MADVNLSVAVSSSGIPDAISRVNSLKTAGLQTGRSLAELAEQSSKLMSSVTAAANATTKATTNMAGYGRAISLAEKASSSLSRELAVQEKLYSRLARSDPQSTATSRLTRLGGIGGLEEGKNLARVMQQRREAYSADPVKDLIAAEREEQRVLAETARRLEELAAKRRALAAAAIVRGDANLGLARAREDLSNQRAGVDSVAQAQIRLTRATEDLERAEFRRKVTPIAVNDAAKSNERSRALVLEAQAVQRVTAAERELASARSAAAASNNASTRGGGFDEDNAFQSSYSYFIVAGLATQTAQAILGIGTAAITASSQLERSFADVERTFDGTVGPGSQLESLRSKLFELSTTTPNSFVDLSQIAALGNQLGVAAADIEAFTTTIAQYTAISGQSAEDAATAFGRIANLTGLDASKFENLASSITYVARTSVATESSIQNTAKEISALAAGAGFSAQSVVGLAGALSSLAIPPERARGALSLYFGALNSAVAEGGPKLAAFATLTGKTTDELSRLVRENKGQEVFTAFISGLSQLDSVAKTTALDTLGLSTIRVDQTMRALAQNVPLVTKSFAGADEAFLKNTEITRQYAIIQETLATKIKEFQNAIQNAAASLGDSFGPALITVMGFAKDLLVAFAGFAKTDVGANILRIVATVGLLVAVIASVIGAAALFQGSLVVTRFALVGLAGSLTATSPALLRWAGGLVGVKVAADAATVSNTVAAGSVAAVGTAATGASVGLRVFRLALGATGVGLALLAVGGIAEQFMLAGDAAQTAGQKAKDFFGGGEGLDLTEALKRDQAVFDETGVAISQISTKVQESTTSAQGWVAGLESAIGAQVLLGDGTTTTTDRISTQTVAYGENTRAALASALANTEGFQKLFKDTKGMRALQGQGFDQTDFARSILGDPKKGGEKYLAGLTDSIAANIGVTKTQLGYALSAVGSDNSLAQQSVLNMFKGDPRAAEKIAEIKAIAGAYKLVGEASGATSTGFTEATEKAAALDAANAGLSDGLTGLSDGFEGSTSSLVAYQDAVSSGLQKFVSFGDVLKAVQEQAGDNMSLVNASAFGAELSKANDSAVSFYSGLQTLAANGNSSFATQLAELGPEAQGILASALELDGGGQGQLEASARFAAFLASDAFKATFQSEMKESNLAYAEIFKMTGNLDSVKAFIAAQVAGTEAEWAAQNPSLAVAIGLTPPTAAEFAKVKLVADGTLTVESKVVPVLDTTGAATTFTQQVNTFVNTVTGATITLPASLSGPALNASLNAWASGQKAVPTSIASKLNTNSFGGDVDRWNNGRGPVRVPATLFGTNTAQSVFGSQTVRINALLNPGAAMGPLKAFQNRAKGGAIEETPRFATGGGYGRFRGPGTGTSDSILARVSAGEYINTAKSTNFWGPDFFDSLNRKMLPTSFLNMLGGAAASGNKGPSHVANVTVVQNNPLTRDPLKQLRQDSELVASGIWG